MHAFRQIGDSLFQTPPGYAGRAEGIRRADPIGREQGSVHIGFYLNRGTSCLWLEIMTPRPPAQNGNRRLSARDDIRARPGG